MIHVDAAVSVTGLTKEYVTDAGNVLANDRIDLVVGSGEVHALLGENGAGKSTLAHALCGLVHPDAGRIQIHGTSLPMGNPPAAIAAGVGLVAQHFSLVPTLTVWENVVLGREPRRYVVIDGKRARSETAAIADRLGIPLDVDARVATLPLGTRQVVEIIKALFRRARVLILDEPTSVLSPIEADKLFTLIKALRDNGTTVLLVTHRLDEVLQNADRATVLRSGRSAATFIRDTWTSEAIVSAIVGDRAPTPISKSSAPAHEARLTVNALTVERDGRDALHDASLTVRRGEILGVAGVAGNGQDALVEALVGITPPTHGTIALDGSDITTASVRRRRKSGFAYIPADRHRHGVVLPFSVDDNLALGEHGRFGTWSVDRRAVAAEAKLRAETYDIRGPSVQAPVDSLSGGNQQKVVVARELSRAPSVLIADQPTRGLDLGATSTVRRRLVETAEAGSAVVIVSADLDELFELADRIVVIRGGEIVTEMAPPYDRAVIGQRMTGGRAAP